MGKLFSKQRQDIYDAAEHGDKKSVKYFVEELKVDANKLNRDGRSALHLASRTGHLDVVHYLVEECNVNLFKQEDTFSKDTAIHSAAGADQLAVLKYFIEEKKVDVNIKNGRRQTLAFSAAAGNHLHIIWYLVGDKKADATTTDANGDNILFYSAGNGHLDIPKYLLDEKKIKFNLNLTNNFGMNLVFKAASFNRLNALKYFVGEKRIDVNTSDITGETPLHMAALRGYTDVVKYLVEHGANMETKNDVGIPASEYIRKKMPHLLQNLEKMNGKRSRRSLSKAPYSSTMRHSILPTWIPKVIAGHPVKALDGSERSTKIYSYDVDNILLLSDAYIRYSTGSSYQQAKHESVLTVEQVLQNRMDPIAIDVVDGNFDLEDETD